jgi:hypothetical protein
MAELMLKVEMHLPTQKIKSKQPIEVVFLWRLVTKLPGKPQHFSMIHRIGRPLYLA